MNKPARRYYCVHCRHVHRRYTYGLAPCVRCGGPTVLGSPSRPARWVRLDVRLPADVAERLGPRPALTLRWLAETVSARVLTEIGE